MSFASYAKREITNLPDGDRHCRIAALSGILSGACTVEVSDGRYSVVLKTENRYLAKFFYSLIKKDFAFRCGVSVKQGAVMKVYTIKIDDSAAAKRVLSAACIIDKSGNARNGHIDALLIKSPCCRKAYVRGVFLACGYISNPKKTYHAEFVTNSSAYADELGKILSGFELSPKRIARKGHHLVYFKDSEQIAVILNITGAHNALLRYENERIRKNVENNINRQANCESANADKAISAAVKQITSIYFIEQSIGLSSLPPQLDEIARVRLKYPEASLKEIGERLSVPVGKSGVNHRLRKIQQIAEGLK